MYPIVIHCIKYIQFYGSFPFLTINGKVVKRESLISYFWRWHLPGTWSHLWFAGVSECPPWCSIVGVTVTVLLYFTLIIKALADDTDGCKDGLVRAGAVETGAFGGGGVDGIVVVNIVIDLTPRAQYADDDGNQADGYQGNGNDEVLRHCNEEKWRHLTQSCDKII